MFIVSNQKEESVSIQREHASVNTILDLLRCAYIFQTSIPSYENSANQDQFIIQTSGIINEWKI